jgi:hypothetical protein
MNDLELKKKAQLLKESYLFTDLSPAMSQLKKQVIFLVLAGLKPVGETTSSHWAGAERGKVSASDNPVAVANFLDSLGLASRIAISNSYTLAQMSLESRLIEEYDSTENLPVPLMYERVGRLFGYPQTAAAAFAAHTVGQDSLLSGDEQSAIETQSGIPLSFGVSFRLSRSHWREEIEVMRQWADALDHYGFLKTPAEIGPGHNRLSGAGSSGYSLDSNSLTS